MGLAWITAPVRRRVAGVALLAAALGIALLAAAQGCAPQESGTAPEGFDVIIRHGTIYDGSGGLPVRGDVGLRGDRIAAVGDLETARAEVEVDATGMSVAPGFINMLSWSTESLLEDGRSMSEILQGVTLQVMGEGWSMGPLNPAMKEETIRRQGDLKFDVNWTTLGEYMDHLVQRGISTNVASFVGATTVRSHVLGDEDRPPTAAELETMQDLVRQAMDEGALGVGSSLIYVPAFYASTEELIALAAAAGESGGMYISHLRSEGVHLLEAVDELIRIAREAGVPAEIYHLKAAGRENWGKLDQVIARVEAARAEGLAITADMYNYTAGATGLDAAMPPWVQEGGHDAWVARLRDPAIRQRLLREMSSPAEGWENLLRMAGSADKVLLVEFKNDALKALTGKSLAEVAAMRGISAEEAAMDLVIEDDSRVGAIYFLMSEENVRRQIGLPWMSFASDSASMAAEGLFLRSNPHPRAYGSFARLLGHYVRDQQVIPPQEAIRRLTSLPADNLKIDGRGRLEAGRFADVVIFDPLTVGDLATYQKPHQYATGMLHVFVNGVAVVRDGEHTGARPGRVVRGPGWVAAAR